MKILEFRDVNNKNQRLPLLKNFFKNVSYPLCNEMHIANLVTNNNEILQLRGSNFKLINLKDCEGYRND